jgi:hypothetical protein
MWAANPGACLTPDCVTSSTSTDPRPAVKRRGYSDRHQETDVFADAGYQGVDKREEAQGLPGVIVLFVQIDTADTRNSKQINHFRKAPQAEGQSNASACQGTYFRCEVHQSARKVRLPHYQAGAEA